MKTSGSIILASLASALIAGAAGYYVGKTSSPSLETAGTATQLGSAGGREVEAAGQGPADSTGDETALTSEERAASMDALTLASGTGTKAGGSVREVLDQPGPMARWQDMIDLAANADAEGVAAALEELQNMPGGIDTIVGRFFLYSRYADHDPATALEALKEMPRSELDIARPSILGAWAAEDPEAAAAWLTRNRADDGVLEGVDGRMIGSVVDEWARTDPEAAWEWSQGLQGNARLEALNSLLGRWASSDPSSAAATAGEMDSIEERAGAYQVIARQWAQQDHEATLLWAESLPPGEADGAVSQAVQHWAAQEPVAAAAYLETMAPGGERDQAMRRIAASWSEQDPAGAVDWAMTQPEGDQQRKAVRDIVRNWAGEDSLAASEWLTGQPPGQTTDMAIASLTNVVAGNDPEGAMIWAMSMDGDGARSLQVKGLAIRWLSRDREAARAWIQVNDLPTDLKEDLMSR